MAQRRFSFSLICVSYFAFSVSRLPFAVINFVPFSFRVSRFPFPVFRCRHLCVAFLVSRFPFSISRLPSLILCFLVRVSISRFPLPRRVSPVFRFSFPVLRWPVRKRHARFAFTVRDFRGSRSWFEHAFRVRAHIGARNSGGQEGLPEDAETVRRLLPSSPEYHL